MVAVTNTCLVAAVGLAPRRQDFVVMPAAALVLPRPLAAGWQTSTESLAFGTPVQVYPRFMSEISLVDGSWVPDACTLPTAERPLRLAEFDALFATAVRAVDRIDETRLRLGLVAEAGVAARVAELVVRETTCCSYFTFNLVATGGDLTLDVTVPSGQVDVLDALTERALAGARP